MKVGLVASAGGHLAELLEVGEAWASYEHFYVTTNTLVKEKLRRRTRGEIYVVGEANREHPFRVVRMLAACARIVWRERPDVVVSTGAAPGCLVCFLGKLMGAKVVWIDSIANVERPSFSGRMVRPIADVFLVQWPELAPRYVGAEYVGEVI